MGRQGFLRTQDFPNDKFPIFLCQICMSEPVVLASLIEKLTKARSVSEEVVRSSEAKTVAE